MLSTYLGFNNPLTPSYIDSKGIFLKDFNISNLFDSLLEPVMVISPSVKPEG